MQPEADNAVQRKRELAKLHIAPKELGIPDDVRKAMIGRISGGKTDSCAGLTAKQRSELLMEFHRIGWRPKGCAAQVPVRPHRSRQEKYLLDLWKKAAKAGVVHHPELRSLQSFISKINHLDMEAMEIAGLKPYSHKEISNAIDAVKAKMARKSKGEKK